MKKIIEGVSRVALAVCCLAVPVLTFGCSNANPSAEDGAGVGTVTIALTATGQSGTVYQLRQAVLELQGPEPRVLSLNGADEVVRVELAPGTYSAVLDDGWQIAKHNSDDSFEPVHAALRTPQPQSLAVNEGAVTDLVLRFSVGEDAVTFGKGRIDVSVGIDEVDDAGPAAICGNGVVESGEACDDGNAVDDDACRSSCVPAACGDGVVQAVNGEACDDGGESSFCTATCTRKPPTIPADLPNTPLVYVASGRANVSGPDFASVPPGAPVFLVLGMYPQRACGTVACSYDLSRSPARAVGYVRVGELTFPIEADLVGSMVVVNGSDLLQTDSFSMTLSWSQSAPFAALASVSASGDARGNVAGFETAAMPRDLTGFPVLDFGFNLETTQGSNSVSSSGAQWRVLDRGATCGDSIVAPGVETCDDGNQLDGDGCSAACRWELAPPAVPGVVYSVYGQSGVGTQQPGTPALLTAHAELQPTCPDEACRYPIDDVKLRIGASTEQAETGVLTVNNNRFFQFVDLFGVISPNFGADLGSPSSGLESSALPLGPLDVTRFGSSAGLFSQGAQNGPVIAWHASLVDCTGGSCSCTLADCPAAPFCGVFPDGCGGYKECGCANGVACSDGICPAQP